MKNKLTFFFLLFTLFAYGQSSNVTATKIRAEESLRVGTTSSQAVSGFNTTMPGAPTDTKLPTSKCVFDWVTGACVLSGGTASGDLSGTYPGPTVDGLMGRPISATAPMMGQVYKWSGSQWVPANDDNTGITALTGDVTASGPGSAAATIGTGVVGPTQLASTSVTPGLYTSADITVDADGRITGAANGSGGGGGASDALGTGFTSGGGAGDIPASTVATMIGTFEISGGTDLTLNPGADIVIGQAGAIQNIVAPDGPGTTAGGGFRFVSGTSDGDGGDMLFESGSSNSDANGGNVFFVAGSSAEDGNGGNFFFSSGASVSGSAGGFNMTASEGEIGGGFLMEAGESFGTIGGSFIMNAGNSPSAGGYLSLNGGSSPGGVGGDIFLNPGTGSTSGTVRLTAPSGFRAIQNIGNISGSDKTFTWPNQSATLSTATSGTAAPSSTPVALGQIYVDTANLKIYISAGTSSSADWKILN